MLEILFGWKWLSRFRSSVFCSTSKVYMVRGFAKLAAHVVYYTLVINHGQLAT